jgi:hypothetical protein
MELMPHQKLAVERNSRKEMQRSEKKMAELSTGQPLTIRKNGKI